jgi:2-haloacid dehalogenase
MEITSPKSSQSQPADHDLVANQPVPNAPSVLLFDVNESLLDFESMAPLFEQIFGDRRILREWMGHLFMYPMTLTLSGHYGDFFTLGQGLLSMLADIHGVGVTDGDIQRIKDGMLTMPPHPDVEDGLTLLRDNGFRLVTLTNSPSDPHGQSPLARAGLSRFFERQFSVNACRAFKPAQQVYHYLTQELDVAPSTCMMVAAHVWDYIGAQSAGFSSALITRPGDAPLRIHGLPRHTFVAPDLRALAEQLITVHDTSAGHKPA